MRALGQPWELAVFLWVPLILFAVVAAAELHLAGSLKDWEIFRAAAHSVVHGRSPFPPATTAALAHGDKYVYPPITALCSSRRSHFLPCRCRQGALPRAGARLRAARPPPARCPRLALLRARASHGAGGRHAEPRRDQLHAAPRRRAGLALPRPALRRRCGHGRHRGRQALRLAALRLAAGHAPLPDGARRCRQSSVAPARGRLGDDRLRRTRQLPPPAAGAHEGGRGAELLARRVAAGRRRRSHRSIGSPRDRRDRRGSSWPPAARTAIGGRSRSPSPARFSPRRCCGSTTSTCCSSRSLSPARGCRRSGSRPLAFWITPLAHSGGSVWRICLVLAVRAYVVWRTVVPAATRCRSTTIGPRRITTRAAFVLTSAAIGWASSCRSRTRAG